MNATRSASDLSLASDRAASSDEGVRGRRVSAAFSAVPSLVAATPSNPFASLKQERTVEARVSMQVLSLAKGPPAGGATCTYQVPEELLELTRRKKGEHAQRQLAILAQASEEAPAAAQLMPKAQEVGSLAFPEQTRSSCVTLTEELRLAPPVISLRSQRRPLLPSALVYAIAAVVAYSIVRLLLK